MEKYLKTLKTFYWISEIGSIIGWFIMMILVAIPSIPAWLLVLMIIVFFVSGFMKLILSTTAYSKSIFSKLDELEKARVANIDAKEKWKYAVQKLKEKTFNDLLSERPDKGGNGTNTKSDDTNS